MFTGKFDSWNAFKTHLEFESYKTDLTAPSLSLSGCWHAGLILCHLHSPLSWDSSIWVQSIPHSCLLDVTRKESSPKVKHCCWSFSGLHEGTKHLSPSGDPDVGNVVRQKQNSTPHQECGNPCSRDSFFANKHDALSKTQVLPVPQHMCLKNYGSDDPRIILPQQYSNSVRFRCGSFRTVFP